MLERKVILSAWGKSRFRTHGWWVIFKDTKRLTKAQAFVRWLNRAPGWQPQARNRGLSRQATAAVERAAIAAFHAVASGNQADLEVLLDSDAARIRSEPRESRSRFSSVEPILAFGNERIAFVLVSGIGSGDSFYGMRQMIFIFRNQDGAWRILHMDSDAVVPIVSGPQEMGPPPLLATFDSHIVSELGDSSPQTAALVEPADRAVLGRWPERPEIAWRSEAPADSAFVVESQFTSPGDEVNWSVSALTFARISRREQPFRQRALFGVGMQPHRWRIWTILPSGAISISSWRTVLFSD